MSAAVLARFSSGHRLRSISLSGALVLGVSLAASSVVTHPGRSPGSDEAPADPPATRTAGGTVREARDDLRRAERRHGPLSPESAAALLRLAERLRAGSPADLEEAGSIARRAVAVRESLHGSSHPEVAAALEALAQIQWMSGDYEGEKEAAGRALAIREGFSPKDDAAIARDLHFLAEAHRARGEYGEALQIRERIGPILLRLHGSEDVEVAVHLHATALLEEATGDLASAVGHAEAAVRTREKVLGPADPLLASTLNLLGHLLIRSGDISRAEPLVARALSIWEASSGPDHVDVARALSNLGTIAAGRGDPAGALPPLTRALSIRRKAFGEDHVLVARSLYALGAVERGLGDVAAARTHLGRAVEIEDGSPMTAHPELATSLRELAALEWEEGDAAAALDRATRAEKISREHFLMTAEGLSEREALRYARGRAKGMDLAMTAAWAIAGTGPAEQAALSAAYDELVRSRALVLDVLAARHRMLALHQDGNVRALYEELQAARGRLANLTIEGSAQPAPDRILALTTKAREEAESAERELARLVRGFREDRARESVGLDDLRRALPSGSALVSFVRYTEAPSRSGRQGSARYAAFVLRDDGSVRMARLGPASVIDAAVESWSREVGRDPRLSLEGEAEGTYRIEGRRLAEAVWGPISALVSGARKVFFVLDGMLLRLNFAALVSPEGTYLLESGPTFHYLSSERDLVRPDVPASGRGLLALGDPDFGSGRILSGFIASRDGVIEERSRFDPLPGSRREVEEIAAEWAPQEDVLALMGSEADESSFKRLSPRFRILHIGTHAFFEIGKRGRGGSTESTGGNGVESASSYPLAGLALAGANLRDGARGDRAADDGILTAGEIALLDLSHVEWAVLSACSTGTGTPEEGEGILGLRRAFQIAGARTLIMSLWPVEDEATRHWMRELYACRRAGMSTADSMRRSASAILESQRFGGRTTHPYYWAGFVAAGDWR